MSNATDSEPASKVSPLNALISHHIFLFPFEWKPKDKTKIGDLSIFGKDNEKPNWERQTLKDTPNNKNLLYNEYQYFYDFVRKVLYDDGNEKSPIRHYKYKSEHLQYEIKKGEDTFTLDVDKILLNLYNTGVGTLSFHLSNKEYIEPNDILKINEYGRRIYPPFLDGQGKSPLLADSIKILKGGEEILATNFQQNSADIPPKNIENSLVKHFLPNEQTIDYEPVLDDRMFVLCWYGNKIANGISQKSNKEDYDFYKKDNPVGDFWYKYLFVDTKYEGVANDDFRKDLLEKQTYTRWTNYNTLYGVSRYSFVCLTKEYENMGATYIVDHMKTIYYRIVELVLVQRASVLHFSELVTSASELEENNTDGEIAEEIRNLYKRYIQFVNKFYFRAVTAQEQGIELYELVKKNMRIDDDVKDLDNEIGELHGYASMLEEKRNNRLLTSLSIIGALLIIPTFITGYFGMNVMPKEQESFLQGSTYIYWVIGLLISTAIASFCFLKTRKKWLQWLIAILILLFSFCVLSKPFFSTN